MKSLLTAYRPCAVLIGVGLAAAMLSAPARSAVTTYTAQAPFALAAAALGQVQTASFESVAAGTTFAPGGGVEGLTFADFSASIGAEAMRIGNRFPATSGTRYLGLNNGNDAFYAGDAFTIQFPSQVLAVGLYVITGPGVLAGDFTLTVGGNRAAINSATPDRVLSDGSTAYFVGLIESNPAQSFNSVRLSSVSGPLVVFNVDDITTAVPEPAQWLMWLGGLWALAVVRSRARRREPLVHSRPVAMLAVAATAWAALPQAAHAQATDAFIGQTMCAAFSFAPRGWARMEGQLLPINQNQALFALLGTQFGGNGQTTFALPDMRGRVIKHQGQGPGLANVTIGERGGSTTVTLAPSQLPVHSHSVALPATTAGATSASPANGVPAQFGPSRSASLYGSGPGTVPMAAATVAAAGSASPVPVATEAPYLVISCYIALQGIFPSPN